MNKYKYKEHEYASLVLNNGFQSSHFGRELRLAAMYCREVFGLDKAGVRRRLHEYCEKYLSDYNEAKHFGMINYAVKEAFKEGNILISVESVQVYEGELQYIDSLPLSRECRKVMLTLLVNRKLSKAVYERKNPNGVPYTNICWGGGRTKYNELKKASNIPSATDIHKDIISELGEHRYINILHNGLISLDWIYNTSETGKVVMNITDFLNIGLYYDRYRGDVNVKECEVCSGLFRLRANNQRYCCKDCSAQANLIKTRARYRKLRAC